MNNSVNQIISALRAAGGKGLVVDELAKSLDIDSDTIIEIVNQMIMENRVMEKSDANEARYFLQDEMSDEVEQSRLSDLNGCPCFHCLKISRCGVRQPDSPVACRNLESWMITEKAIPN
ncbi:MAG: hypothetical protein ACFFEF_14170 [Candidatus Thorarchaeota archaeon]